MDDKGFLVIPHWVHGIGYWLNKTAKAMWCSGDNDIHNTIASAIAEAYRGWYPEAVVTLDTPITGGSLFLPATDQGRQYRPDICVCSQCGRRLVAVEYQRTYESFDHFLARHLLRVRDGWVTHWWFADQKKAGQRDTIYEKSRHHRAVLRQMGFPFFRVWIDPVTQRLHAEEGNVNDVSADDQRKAERELVGKPRLPDCSISAAIGRMEKAEQEENRSAKTKEGLLAPRPGSPVVLLGGASLAASSLNLDTVEAFLAQEQRDRERAQALASAQAHMKTVWSITERIRAVGGFPVVRVSEQSPIPAINAEIARLSEELAEATEAHGRRLLALKRVKLRERLGLPRVNTSPVDDLEAAEKTIRRRHARAQRKQQLVHNRAAVKANKRAAVALAAELAAEQKRRDAEELQRQLQREAEARRRQEEREAEQLREVELENQRRKENLFWHPVTATETTRGHRHVSLAVGDLVRRGEAGAPTTVAQILSDGLVVTSLGTHQPEWLSVRRNIPYIPHLVA
jgi:hypothetical protein